MATETLDTTGTQADRRAIERIVIVADDLTGACDSAVAFALAGWPTRVSLSSSSVADRGGATAVNTDSRNLAAADAAERVAEAVASLQPGSAGILVFQKIDSAARGNMAAEVSAALEASGAALALVTPAFPGAGRMLRSGILHIHDFAGQNTTMDLREQFTACDVLPTGYANALEHAIKLALAKGTRILLCDALTQSDLEQLASAALRVQQPLLWAGSAGLARALAGQLSAPERKALADETPRAGRTMLFVGTPHPVTQQQLDYLQQMDTAGSCAIHFVEFTERAERQIIEMYKRAPVKALILTGGDTAGFVLGALSATAIKLAGEVSPGIPYGRIEGGLADGCTVITKSGGFGQRDALFQAFNFSKRNTLASA